MTYVSMISSLQLHGSPVKGIDFKGLPAANSIMRCHIDIQLKDDTAVLVKNGVISTHMQPMVLEYAYQHLPERPKSPTVL